MGELADRFRDRARECRRLAAATCDGAAKTSLNEIAAELEEEADKMDGEEGLKKVANTRPKPAGA
jgi:hypothetical protein